MTRRLLGAVAALAIVVGSDAQPVAAQFALGYTDIGATVGLGNIGASAAFGGRFEKGLWAAPEGLGTGVIGLQAGLTYYSWNEATFYSYTYIPIGVTANYHFNLTNDRIDPFLGLGLGYYIVTCDYDGPGGDFCSASALYFIGRAGLRYFVSPNLALYGDAGAGAAALNFGVMFKIGG